ncbi:MAG: DUF4097 domain-containing protein [Thermoanaerobaculia bacterium]
MQTRIARLALLAAMMIAAAGCYSPSGKRVELAHTYDAASINQVQIRGISGRIEVVGNEASSIEVTVSSRAERGDSEELAKRIEIRQEGDSLVIRERKNKGSRRILAMVDGGRPSISFEVTMPARMRLTASTVNGRVAVERVLGETALKSVNGRLQVSTPGAEVSASTVNGSIRAEFQNQFRGGAFKTINGSIAVEVPHDASLDLDIHQVNGSFHTDLPVVIQTSGRRSTRGSLHGGRYPLEIETVNGSVRLRQADPPPSPFAGELPPVSSDLLEQEGGDPGAEAAPDTDAENPAGG